MGFTRVSPHLARLQRVRGPHGQARRLAADRCHKGADVTYEPVVLPDVVSPLSNHFGPLLTDQGDAVSWLTDRLSVPNCWSLPLQH
jgi:hypothetical protein